MNCNNNLLIFDFDNYMQFDFKLAFDISYQKRSDYKIFLKVMIYQGPETNFNDIEPPLIVRNWYYTRHNYLIYLIINIS